uniref:Fibronectin type-III domain-containing protein n=1 Tax=uncultured organism TaxID=155900 RepID=E3T348_9ZZZZ|nr:hypothetical protein [uncultured organism]
MINRESIMKTLIPLLLSMTLLACSDGGSSSTSPDGGDGTGQIIISWAPPTSNTDGTELTNLANYKIYYGESPDRMTNIIQFSNTGQTSYEVDNLDSNTLYFFTMSSLNSLNVESTYSEIISQTAN